MMNAEIKAKWLTALRSGRYKQAHKRLFDGESYCCLGVLCDILEPNGWRVHEDLFRHPLGGKDECLIPAFRDEIGISSNQEDQLTIMNDGRNASFEFQPVMDFPTIANWIEENL